MVGAEKGDLKSKQFWVAKDTLLFVRDIEPSRQDPTKPEDIHPLIREAWDGEAIVIPNRKGNALSTTDYTVSVVGDITPGVIRKTLETGTEAFDGYANRERLTAERRSRLPRKLPGHAQLHVQVCRLGDVYDVGAVDAAAIADRPGDEDLLEVLHADRGGDVFGSDRVDVCVAGDHRSTVCGASVEAQQFEAVEHDFSTYTFISSGPYLVVEGTTRGSMKNGKAWAGGETPGGRFCNVFEFRGNLICRVHIYLDPDYGGADQQRFLWGDRRDSW